jgi:hypothetical protein
VHFAIDAENFRAGGSTQRAGDPRSAVAARFAASPGGKGVARVDPRIRVAAGERVALGLDVERLHFFDPVTGVSLPSDKSARMEVPAL